MPPTLASGKICYIELPAIDVHRSADFYAGAFGWHIRKRGDAFDLTAVAIIYWDLEPSVAHFVFK